MPHLEEDVSESIMKHELFYKAIPKVGKKHSYGLTTDDSSWKGHQRKFKDLLKKNKPY